MGFREDIGHNRDFYVALVVSPSVHSYYLKSYMWSSEMVFYFITAIPMPYFTYRTIGPMILCESCS